MSELGEFLKELRGDRSLRDIAKITGLSHTYIADIENGYRRGTNKPLNPSPESLRKLSDAYKHPYLDLMSKAGYFEDLTEDDLHPVLIENKMDAELLDAFTTIKSYIKDNQIKFKNVYDKLAQVITDEKVNITLNINYSDYNFEQIQNKVLRTRSLHFKKNILEVLTDLVLSIKNKKIDSEEPIGMSFYGGSSNYTEEEIQFMEAALRAFREQKQRQQSNQNNTPDMKDK